MRLIVVAIALLPSLSNADGYCVMPELRRGVPVTIAVEHIGKESCGVALIEKRPVRIEEVAVRKVKWPAKCGYFGDTCTRRAEYFLSAQDEIPYIVIFKGPRNPHG